MNGQCVCPCVSLIQDCKYAITCMTSLESSNLLYDSAVIIKFMKHQFGHINYLFIDYLFQIAL
jgi:hypothetical protein